MAKLPYGFDAKRVHFTKNPWENLNAIAGFLQAQKVIPPDLAIWLGEAIRHSKEDSAELLRQLGMKSRRGKPPKFDDAWLIWGQRICDLEDEGMKPEAAIEQVAAETDNGQEELYSRSQLQSFRNIFRQARHEAQNPQ